MELRNTTSSYGIISKILHWTIALLILVQFYLVYWKRWMLTENSSIANFYIDGLHKPIGAVILTLAIFAVTWKVNNPKPGYPDTMPNWEKQSAIFVQSLLYLILFAMPISGLLMSTAAGYPPNFFGLFQFPQFLEKNEVMAQFFFDVHEFTGNLVIALVVIHVGAALKHHFYDRDDVLRRMLP